MSIIKGSIKPKPQEKPVNTDMASSILGTVQLFNDLQNTKVRIEKTLNDKVSEVESIIEEAKNTVSDGAKKIDNKISEFNNTAVSLIQEIKGIPTIKGEPGKDADEQTIQERILASIPSKEEIINEAISRIPKLDTKALTQSILKAIPDNKASLKIVQEKIETDPISVIEKIMALPKGKFKLKMDNIDGLEQTMSAFNSQLGRGYLHGGGDTVKAGTGITITTNSAGNKVISSTSSGGTVSQFNFTNGGGFTGVVSNPTSTPTLSITLQNASTSQSGQLTSTDWNTFNNKGSGTVTSVSGTTNRITVATGTSTPIIDISASYVGQSSITTLGTIGTGVWQGTKIGLLYGGTNADLSATGGASNYLKQSSSGAAITVGTIPASDIASGAALTKTNDTNVTLTLGGTPSTSLLVATSLTLGWTGTLANTRGGTGADSSASTGVAQISSGTWSFSTALANGTTATTQASTDNSTKVATDAYVTTAIANAISGVNPAVAVQAATTSAGNTSGLTYNNGVGGIGATFTGSNNTALTIDGFTFTTLGQRLLVKNDTQSPSGAFNGVYYVTQIQTAILPPILTRALDYDMPSDINNTGAIPVVNGTVNALTSWLLTSSVTTVGTDPLTYSKFSNSPVSVLTPDLGGTGIANNAASTLTISGNFATTFVVAAATTQTFPTTSATLARTDAAQTFTGIQTIPQVVNTPLAATVTSNAATITRASRINNFTNSSAATMAITLSTSGALDGDLLEVRVYDFSAVAQTIGWTNTENSTVSVPTTSNGSTTLPLSVLFQFNGATSKFRCLASS